MFWKGVIGYLPANLVQAVTGLLAIVVFTRLLTPEAYGAYAVAFSVTTLVHTGLFTWLEAAMARYQAREAELGGLPAHMATLYRSALALAFAVPIVGGVLLFVIPLMPEVRAAVLAGLLSIPLRNLVKLAQERRRAAGEVRASAALDISQSAGAFGFGAALAWMGAGGAAPLAGFALAALVTLAWVLPRELKHAPGGRFEAARAREYARFGLPVALSMIMALVVSSTDRLMIAGLLGEASAGVYHAGYSLSNRTLDVLFIWLGMAGGPAAVAAFERGGLAALQREAREQASLILLICVPAAAGLALVARPLADVMIGEQMRSGAAQVTPWIALGGFFAGVTTHYLYQAFTLARRTGLVIVALGVPAVLNVALNLLLIPRFGLSGAMWAAAASYAAGAAAALLLGRRVMPLPIPLATLGKVLLTAAGMAAAVLALPAWGGFPELALKAGVGAAVYALLAIALDIAGARSRLGGLARTVQANAA
ncbi:MAG TPA: lipopolysaccharide biosynthesis protein [Caulobacteraceae bacterium]|jgi:O-antigen/teichoic acid export membrane protein